MASLLALVSSAACIAELGDGDGNGGETEIISKIELTFTPTVGGDAIVVAFTDPDGDGGMSGIAEDIELLAGTEYELTVAFINELEDPPEDITDEIREEAEEHMIFIAGSGVAGPASNPGGALVTHAYADLESDYGSDSVGDDLPVGLANTVEANLSGDAELRVVLRHLPELNDEAQKTAELPQRMADGENLPGDVDADVTFALKVVDP